MALPGLILFLLPIHIHYPKPSFVCCCSFPTYSPLHTVYPSNQLSFLLRLLIFYLLSCLGQHVRNLYRGFILSNGSNLWRVNLLCIDEVIRFSKNLASNITNSLALSNNVMLQDLRNLSLSNLNHYRGEILLNQYCISHFSSTTTKYIFA